METLKSCSLVFVDGDWIESKDQSDNGIRLVQTGNVGNGEYLDKSDRAKFISEDTFLELKCTEIFEGDILISRLPDPVGRSCLLPNIGKAITAVDCSILRVDTKKCIPEFLVYYTQTEFYKSKISQFLAGTTRTRISRKNLENIEINLPDLNEQKKIVDILSKVDRLISYNNNCLTKLEYLVKSRFIELFGDIVLNPNEFEEGVVSEYCKMTQGTQIPMSEQRTDYQQGYYRYLYIRDLKYNDDNWIYVRDKYDDKKLTFKDLVVVNTGNTAGEIYYGKDGILSNNLFKVSFDSNVLDTTYMFAYFSSQQFQNMLWSEMKEGTQPHLGHKIFGSKKLLVPPMELQQQFATFVEQTDKSKLAVQQSLEKLETLKKSLMQQYFG